MIVREGPPRVLRLGSRLPVWPLSIRHTLLGGDGRMKPAYRGRVRGELQLPFFDSGDSAQLSTHIGLRALPVCGVQQYNSHFRETRNSIILTCMPAKLKAEIVTAAIAGFEQQKKRLNAQIAELRQMLNPSATDGRALMPARRRMSAAARARIAAAQRKRWAAARKQAGAA